MTRPSFDDVKRKRLEQSIFGSSQHFETELTAEISGCLAITVHLCFEFGRMLHLKMVALDMQTFWMKRQVANCMKQGQASNIFEYCWCKFTCRRNAHVWASFICRVNLWWCSLTVSNCLVGYLCKVVKCWENIVPLFDWRLFPWKCSWTCSYCSHIPLFQVRLLLPRKLSAQWPEPSRFFEVWKVDDNSVFYLANSLQTLCKFFGVLLTKAVSHPWKVTKLQCNSSSVVISTPFNVCRRLHKRKTEKAL